MLDLLVSVKSNHVGYFLSSFISTQHQSSTKLVVSSNYALSYVLTLGRLLESIDVYSILDTRSPLRHVRCFGRNGRTFVP
jgi:hypothetical protein